MGAIIFTLRLVWGVEASTGVKWQMRSSEPQNPKG